MFSYMVRCEIEDAAIAKAWIDWLITEHIDDVMNAGALSAEILELDPCVYEIRYRFESEHAFQIYEDQHAARLRSEGLRKFPLERGLKYSRSTARTIHKSNC